MNFLEILSIAIALSLDSFAVSIAGGTILGKVQLKHFFQIALYMGFFQGLMPLLGWLVGTTFQQYIAHCDHWIAFGLLTLIGGRMIYEGLFKVNQESGKGFDPTRSLTLLGLAIATSIDALAVGISFAMLRISVFLPILVIGVVTFLLSLIGTFFGVRLGSRFSHRIEVIGGSILILIGLKILLEHLNIF